MSRPPIRLNTTSERQRQRELVTPEGLALPVTLASRGSRAGALLLDLLILILAALALLLILLGMGIGLLGQDFERNNSAAFELILVAILIVVWFTRYGYFLYFELGPRGATPGKRIVGIRVAARPAHGNGGGRLTAEAVIARNLLRDIELFLPLGYLIGMIGNGQEDGVMGWAAVVWLLVFLCFPFFNKDRLRGGDLIAGTWVVEAPRVKLAQVMPTTSTLQRQDYRFGEAELAVYGEHELKVLENVLRQNHPDALREVTEAICRKIGWTDGGGHDREFLETFYAALRAHLERGLRFGKRKADKHS